MKTVALVTGASRGLGRELAIGLYRSGHRVIVNYKSQRDNPDGILPGSDFLYIRADVGNVEAVKRMRDTIADQIGRLDVIINNAGITKDRLLINYDEEDWDDVMRVNLKGCYNVIKYLTPIMIESGGGNIINIASRSGLRGNPGQAAYSASKAAIMGMTLSLAKELAPFNIRVNCIIPGYMPTDMGKVSRKALETAKRQSLLGTLTRTEDVFFIIEAILKSNSVTGQILSVDSRL